MPLIKCPSCEKEISSEAKDCPSCGHPIKKQKKSGRFGCTGIVLIALVILMGLGYLGSQLEDSDSGTTSKSTKAKSKTKSTSSDYTVQNFVTVAGYIACITKADKERSTRYMINNDTEAASSLIEAGRCIILKGGDEVFREDVTWGGLAEIRPKGVTSTLWTNIEAIKEK